MRNKIQSDTKDISRIISELLFTSDLSTENADYIVSVWISYANQKQINNVCIRLWYNVYFR
jgi:hypothetical protein